MSSALSSLAAYADRISSSSSSGSPASSDDEVQVEKVQQSPASGGSGAAAAPKARKSAQKGIAGLFSKPALTPQQPQKANNETRDEQRRNEVAATEVVDDPTAPEKAAHIDKSRVVRTIRKGK